MNNPMPTAVIRPMRLAHVVFRTTQLQRMIDWYCQLLGAHVVFGDSNIAFLTYDDEHHRIALLALPASADRGGPTATRSGSPPRLTPGFYHAAFAYRNLGELLANYQRLKAVGIESYRKIIHGPTVSMYYQDPDGNQIELQVDVFPTPEKTTEWMNGEAFRRDPIGILFDPEEMLERRRRGVADSELMRRPDDMTPR